MQLGPLVVVYCLCIFVRSICCDNISLVSVHSTEQLTSQSMLASVHSNIPSVATDDKLNRKNRIEQSIRPHEDQSIMIAGAIAGAFVVLLGILGTMFCCYRKESKSKLAPQSKDGSTTASKGDNTQVKEQTDKLSSGKTTSPTVKSYSASGTDNLRTPPSLSKPKSANIAGSNSDGGNKLNTVPLEKPTPLPPLPLMSTPNPTAIISPAPSVYPAPCNQIVTPVTSTKPVPQQNLVKKKDKPPLPNRFVVNIDAKPFSSSFEADIRTEDCFDSRSFLEAPGFPKPSREESMRDTETDVTTNTSI